ncbi:helix-turn-helix transcriptional regulator [Glycomyces sp. A-F 0318]|uniref:Scr1 family TA system antitoxin-like transcriptional regulator n=1 Tax=Glycomyces amatae TaxID=2881355 RepID=UPI001E5719DB|nr:Scr1 family TA system antitoxin-like transcriptional regulator [Glycomyces amatae]MCD0446624.1 helix-turn-helix transcriptional regulator [Glycomyces amatae]
MPLSRVAEWYVLAELAALITESDLTYAQIAEPLGVSTRTVQNYVSGDTRPKAGMAARLAQICGAAEKRIDFLTHVISQLDSGVIVSDLNKRNIFIVERGEATAGEIWKFEPMYVPGPFQTLRYHLEMLPEQGQNPMQNWQRKLQRYTTLKNRRNAPAIRTIMHANALRVMQGWDGAEEQFEHLLEIGRWPNSEIRIVDGLIYGFEHAHDHYRPAGFLAAPPPFVYVEAIDQSRHIEEPEKIDLYYDRVRSIWQPGRDFGGRFNDWIR